MTISGEVKNTDTSGNTSNSDLRLSLPKLFDAQTYRGLVIGDQKDGAELYTERKSSQSAYKNLLADDMEKKTITRICSVHRKSIGQIYVHEDSQISGLNIGKDKDIEKQEKRDAKKILLAQTLVDLGDNLIRLFWLLTQSHSKFHPYAIYVHVEEKAEAKSRQQLLLRKQEMLGTFSIGGKDIDRIIKKEGKKKYLALPSTTNSPPTEGISPRPAMSGLPVELNLITGLQIGTLDNLLWQVSFFLESSSHSIPPPLSIKLGHGESPIKAND